MGDPITIILLTYKRTECAVRTIEAMKRNFRYAERQWYVADDGSPNDHFRAVMSHLQDETVVGQHTYRAGYGASANRALEAVREFGDLIWWLEDDWELQHELQIAPHVRVLLEHPEFGMIRFGYLNLGLEGMMVGLSGVPYWHLNRKSNCPVLTGHPSLRHRRLHDAYGPYTEELPAGVTELDYAAIYQQKTGPEVLWPAELGAWGIFGHIGNVKAEDF